MNRRVRTRPLPSRSPGISFQQVFLAGRSPPPPSTITSPNPTIYAVLAIVYGLLAIFVAGWYIRAFKRSREADKLPLPPGPPRLPVIGNLHQAPKLWPWRTYREWAKTYGPIMSLQYGKDTVIVLSSHNAAKGLLDKRSNVYSSRPRLVMGQECVSRGQRSVLMPYAAKYRNHQRIQGGLVQPRYAQQYVKLQNLESLQLLHDLLSATEDNWMHAFHRYSASLIFGLAYGKRMPRGDEPELQSVATIMDNFLYAARVGTWIVDALPFLNYLPRFLAPWKRIADGFHEFEAKFHLRVLAEGLLTPGWNWTKLANSWKESSGMSEEELAYCVGSMYEAGSDTTTMALHSFVMAALTAPEAMREVQRDLDSTVGDRMPEFDDRGRLACIEAVVKETLRWRPVSAGGIPHAIDQKDDEYMGYRIPKGAIIVPNHWAMDLDEEVYGPDALDFRPSRWIENPALPLASFGYGRRACTGQHVAMNSLFINIARVLWAFDIECADNADEKGGKVQPDPLAYSQGINSGPLPFKAKFVVRSPERRAVVEERWRSADKDVRAILDEIEKATSKIS